jgi:hypothetical protein
MEGKLKEAKMVRQSRTAKRAYDSFGTTAAAGAAAEEDAPNMRAKHESLYTHRLMFTDDVARNLDVLGVTVEAGLEVTVECKVSTVLAVEYVAK